MIVAGQDRITAASYDFSGRRLATCSADHTVKVFDKSNDNWVLNDSWRAHDAAVTSVSWAGPQYAPLLVSSSHDCTVKIWEEVQDESFESSKRWRRKHTFTDFQGPVYACQFNPLGAQLQLAAVAADGILRVYESTDPGNLASWSQTTELPLLNRPVARQLQSSFALSWAPTPSFMNWLAVAALDDAIILRPTNAVGATKSKYAIAADLPGHQGLVRDISWAPTFGRAMGIVATACKDGNVRIFYILKEEAPELTVVKTFGGAEAKVEDEFEEEKAKETEKEKEKEKEREAGHATPDLVVLEDTTMNTDYSEKPKHVEAKLVMQSDEHNGEVWHVAWNASGSILASTGDRAETKFWKSVFRGSYKCIAEVSQ